MFASVQTLKSFKYDFISVFNDFVSMKGNGQLL